MLMVKSDPKKIVLLSSKNVQKKFSKYTVCIVYIARHYKNKSKTRVFLKKILTFGAPPFEKQYDFKQVLKNFKKSFFFRIRLQWWARRSDSFHQSSFKWKPTGSHRICSETKRISCHPWTSRYVPKYIMFSLINALVYVKID